MATNDETRAAAKENCDECGKDLPSWVASNIHGTFCSTGCIEAATARGRAKQRTDQRAELDRLRAANAELAAALRLSLDAMDAIDACLSQIGVGYFPIAEHKRKSAERAGGAALARHDAHSPATSEGEGQA